MGTTPIRRRSALKVLVGGGAGVAAAGAAQGAGSPETPPVPADALGLLYDATLCIGCKACVVACREANELPPDTRRWPDGLYDAPERLSAQTKNIIKLYREGNETSYMKQQCMQCLDPACASACMLGALAKREHGIVTWDGTKCVGCRYCQMACPFNVPTFEWEARNPRIVKCELCRHLIARGEGPACAKVCPRGAIVYGRREELLAEAKRRIATSPGRYQPRVYGERDGGGTQCLYLSKVPFEKLGLPQLGETPPAHTSRTLMHGVYRGMIAPAALYALLGAVILRNRRREAAAGEEDVT
jgi:formate dehydrogenase beta subunit